MKDNLKKDMHFKVVKLTIIILLIFSFLMAGAGCRGIFFIPGASYGYYVWEDESGRIHIAWSIDRKESKFSGWVATDGKVEKYDTVGWEDSDSAVINDENNKLEFSAALDENDYSDEIVISVSDYSYLDFELKINDGYDLSRINLGEFINSPGDGIFRVSKGYFEDLEREPWYKKHPWSGFFYKLSADIKFSLIYVFILGAVIIEILRISAFYNKKRKPLFLLASYTILIFIDAGLYFFLKFVVG